jgi:hypothetical protein
VKASDRIQTHSKRTICTSFSFEFLRQTITDSRSLPHLAVSSFLPEAVPCPLRALVRGAVNSGGYELLKILRTEKKQACLDMPWVARHNTYRILGKRSEPTDVTRVISKELNFSAFGPFRIRSIALRTIFCPSITEDSLFNFSGQSEEGPSGFVDLSIDPIRTRRDL